jgi:hypothetical protein
MQERRRVAKNYDCPFCGSISSIEFEVASPSNSEKFERESVVDYGGCKVAAKATNPRKPSPSDLATCPVFKSPK